MSGVAIVMLLVSIGIVWGGLVASIIFLNRRPEVEDLFEDPDLVRDDEERAAQPHPFRDT
ncbi:MULTISPECIES: methionine/alanine import family NSS transporter small subunit [Gordonia]|uniref:Methionine/alanine import family NSS transporter small subunit n=1 Tax=Gordonia amicalis TaxID=89053 RepID=A0ABU4D9R2_9ACTN|nr:MULTISPECIES: methionine/alanine import family NSS transporter small subunit [Gordonia]ATD71892.1 putative methionine/alanine importer small subunit [Gordonia sp. 1D]MBA5848786.1 methionine/alanine import family NSS transporter small subunit [Gordonia amicalis]MCZ0914362.1 methionine/alanine import family NSS transporter small subunit [Gordonia amicalis]MDJ0451613.1 methionine/alanine import family NSS transporter small subunit [Gordonia amicalis]MDV6306464.1 methionine/alanine import famil